MNTEKDKTQKLAHYLTEMIHVQDDLGLRQNTHWREKDWDFKLAALEEVIEAIEHLKWKWWKNPEGVTEKDIDWEAVHYEAADVFNFLTTYLLMECSYHAVVRTFIRGYDRAQVGDFSSPSISNAMEFAKDIIRSLVGYPSMDDDSYASYYGEELTTSYFRFLHAIGLEPARLRAIYLAKAELNIFRWENGFKDGTYIRTWNGVKDDVFLKKIVNMTNEEDPNYRTYIYQSIQSIYSQVKGEDMVTLHKAASTSVTPQVHAQQMQVLQKRPTKAPRPPHETGGTTPPDAA
jgi:hypothetical protein